MAQQKGTVLTIGGSDCSGCAGVQSDLRAIAALGWHGASVITSVTAQNTKRVLQTDAVRTTVVREQLQACFEDLSIETVCCGMLGESMPVLREFRGAYPDVPWVIDLVHRASTGAALQPDFSLDTLRGWLGAATVMTLNADELEALCAVKVQDEAEVAAASRTLLGPDQAVVVKGGHLGFATGTDFLVTKNDVVQFKGPNLDNRNTRGSGGTFAAAIAVGLADGKTIRDATAMAHAFCKQTIAYGYELGEGPGPVNALFSVNDIATCGVGRLHVITSSKRDAVETAVAARLGGADVVQLRDKTSSSSVHRLAEGLGLKAALEDSPCQLVVNDSVDIAVGVGAHGVHLGSGDLSPRIARKMMGPRAIVGATVNTLEQAHAACGQPVDYWGVGPVFETFSKQNPAPPIGLKGLQAIVAAADKPVIAIGGMGAQHVGEVLGTGAYGVAVLSGVTDAEDMTAATAMYADAIAAAHPFKVQHAG